MPWAIYCHPEVAWAGPGEQARDAGYDVVVQASVQVQLAPRSSARPRASARSSPRSAPTADRAAHRRPHGRPWVEQLSGGYLAVNWEATVDEIAEFIQPHPSLTELFGETVLTLTGRNFNG